MDKVYVVVSQNNFENSLINWQNGNALIALIENFFQTNAGIATTFDTIVRDLVVPSLEQIRADLINYPQTLECTQFAHMMVDIEQLHVQQKEFLTTIEKEIKRRRDEPIVKEEIFDKIISELKKINDELQ